VAAISSFVAICDYAAVAENSDKCENKNDQGLVLVIAAVSRELDKVVELFKGLNNGVEVEAKAG
jgi:phosphohistidine swiveling domain-containing protein